MDRARRRLNVAGRSFWFEARRGVVHVEKMFARLDCLYSPVANFCFACYKVETS